MYKYLSAIFWIIPTFDAHFQVGGYVPFPDLAENGRLA